MKKTIIDIIKFLVFFGIGAAILIYIYNTANDSFQVQQIQDGVAANSKISLATKIWNDFQTVSIFGIIIAIILFLLSNVSRAIRWQQLLGPLGYKTSFGNRFWPIILGYFVNMAIPRLGEFTRAATISRNENIPVEKSIGTIVIGRIADMFCLLLIIAITFFIEYDTLMLFLNQNGQLPDLSQLIILGIVGCAFLGAFIWLIYTFRTRKFISKIYQMMVNFGEGLATILKLEKKWLFVAHSLFIWFCYFAMNYVIFLSFAPTEHLTFGNGMLVLVSTAFGMVIPSPGGMGSYHFLVTQVLILLGISYQDGFSFAMISWVSINLGCNIIFGLISLMVLPRLKKNVEQIESV